MLKKLLMAAAITLSFAGASSAAVIHLTDGQTVNPVNTQDVYLYEEELYGSGGAGSRTFTFVADAADAPLSLLSKTANVALTGAFTGAYLSWTSVAGTVFATPITNDPDLFTARLATLFTAPDLLTQTLTLGWTSYNSGQAPFQISLNVAAVPLPAGGLLLFSALGGVAALRRRRKAA